MEIHIVKKGDTLWRLSKEKGVSVEAIAKANKLSGRRWHLLSIDQQLLIPPKHGSADTTLHLHFRGLDFSPIGSSLVRLEYDGQTVECKIKGGEPFPISIYDHTCGLKIWKRNMREEYEQVLDAEILPLGTWNLNIDSRLVKAEGTLQPSKGKPTTTTGELMASTTHNAQVVGGRTVQQQARVDQGVPVHALATIYTEQNLRLSPANEKYRSCLIDSARRHGLTPHALAAFVHAEAAEKKGTGEWIETTNREYPARAQGLAQFFADAWLDVKKDQSSLLYKECAGLNEQALLAKRLVAKYSIDSLAVYATINLRNFSKATGAPVEGLPPEDKTKLAYILHHEGLLGTLETFQLEGKSRTEKQTRARLAGQFDKNFDKADELIVQYGGDANSAYRGWVTTYTDAKINVNTFLIKDAAKFAKRPRSVAQIIADLTAQAKQSKPKPKPKSQGSPTALSGSKPDEAKGALQPKQGSTQSKGSGSSWHPPLSKCKLRTAGLSPTGAKFGFTRNNGTRVHQGVDLIAVPGTPIYAVADGYVYTSKAASSAVAYGGTLVLVVAIDDLPEPQRSTFTKHAPGHNHVGFFYAHLSEMIGGKNPIPVTAGTAIGKSGNSGNAKRMTTVASGAHLHFEVRKEPLKRATGLSNRLDPLLFLTVEK